MCWAMALQRNVKYSKIMRTTVKKYSILKINYWFLWQQKFSKLLTKILKSIYQPIGPQHEGFGNPA